MFGVPAGLSEHPPKYSWTALTCRCLRCVLKNRTCDLVFRAKLPVCTCDWLMSFDHRDLIMERNRLLNEYRVHFSKPWSMRAPDMEVMSFLHRLTSIEDWFGRVGGRTAHVR